MFSQEYNSVDKKVGTYAVIPEHIQRIETEDGVRKCYLVRGYPPNNLENIRQEFIKRGFDDKTFFEVFSLGKAALFHQTIVSVIQLLIEKRGASIHFNGEPVMYYSTAHVDVVCDYVPIDVVKDWSIPDPTQWNREFMNPKRHTVLFFHSHSMGRFFVDFTASQFGVYEKSFKGIDYPILMIPDNKNNYMYANKELISPEELRRGLKEQLKDGFEKHDFFAIAVDSFGGRIYDKLVSLGKQKMLETLYPKKVRKVSLRDAMEQKLFTK